MKIVGILNLTENSFSDGGLYAKAIKAIARVDELFNQGAAVVDIGAASTAYGAVLIEHEEEWSKLEPILRVKGGADISIDTYHWRTAQKALQYGVGYINDVSFGKDPNMLKLIADNPQLKYIMMYSLTLPANKEIRVRKISDIDQAFEEKLNQCLVLGIRLEQVIIDPGIGFATNPAQSFELIRNIKSFKKFKTEILIGHSRKSFLEAVTKFPLRERDLETVITSLYLLDNDVDYVRVHNVEWHQRALNVLKELRK